MDSASEDSKQPDQFDAALPLPIQPKSKRIQPDKKSDDEDPAADLIRKKIEAAYADEPQASAEAHDLRELGSNLQRSKHQQFIYELTASGRPLGEIQTAWHEYYAALPEVEKHEVWQEFYSTHSQASNYSSAVPSLTPATTKSANEEALAARQMSLPPAGIGRSLYGIKGRLKEKAPKIRPSSPTSPWRSLVFGLGVGTMVLLIFLFSFFNERVIAPFIQPSRSVSGTPIIAGTTTIGPDPEIIIPKINVEIPVVYTVATIDDNAVEQALEGGVVHYADTALPGQNGNGVIVGHSSNNIFNPGKYKFAFVLLSRLENGDTFYLQKDGKRYTYQVYKKEIVSPNDVSVLGPEDRTATATLITCDPPGTSANRLVVVGEQIDPSPTSNTAQATTNQLATSTNIIPGNSQSLWSRLIKWLGE